MEHYRRDRVSRIYLISLFGVLSGGLVYYLNFKYGYSMPLPEGDELRQAMEAANARTYRDLAEVRERDYFFVVGFSVWVSLRGSGSRASGTGSRACRGVRSPRPHPCSGSPSSAGAQLRLGQPQR